MIIKCKVCGKKVSAKRKSKKYCSDACCQRYLDNRPARVLKCKWCDKEMIVYFKKGWDKQKFCCLRCREEYNSFNDKRSPFFKADKTKQKILSDEKLYVQCQICGHLIRRRLSTHLRIKHNLKWEKYIQTYPNAKNECQEIRDFAYEFVKRKERIIKKNSILVAWEHIKKRKLKEIGYKCELCGFDKYKEALTGHHKLPKEFGGKDRYKNCIIICSNCHRHIHKKIRKVVKTIYTIEDIVQTCAKA